jgi:phenylpropionate dioxygenase-like ring-hydroxylating dioxygenase large terminal subunit
LLWACLAGCEDSALPPADIDGFRARDIVAVNTVTVRTDFDQVVLGLVDPAHVPMVHNSWWWRSAPRRKEKTKFHVARAVDAQKSSPVYGMLGGGGEVTIEFRLPCLRIERLSGRRNRVVNFTFVTPLRPGVQRLQNIIFSNIRWLKPLSPVLRSFGQTFLEQDARILNMLAKSGRPADRMLFCGDPDVPSLWYFRLKCEFETSRAERRAFRNPVPERMLKWRT